ncbi:MAG: hypothetical protein AMJ92_10385, partial [candidate division Zixibacteria bacterium SM23_81]
WVFRRGGFETRPYMVIRIVFNKNNPVHMIRHNYKFIQSDIQIMNWQIDPTFLNNISESIQLHCAV